MQRYPEYTRSRLKLLAAAMKEKIYPEAKPVDSLVVSGAVDRITLADAKKLKYREAKLGEQFGPQWATFWFKGKAEVPANWAGKRVDLLWISHSEGTLWVDGRSIQGLNYNHGDRPDAVLSQSAARGQKLDFMVEMACNTKFGNGSESRIKNISTYVLDRCDIAIFDPVAWQMYFDFYVLSELELALSVERSASDKALAGDLLHRLNDFANQYDPDDTQTWPLAHEILKELFKRHNGTLAHELSIIGHAHIDSAWLWPLAETDRKCERTFSSQVTYMQDYPEFKFACSQAYQYARIKERNPDLYARIKALAAKGQWIPVGGTWVEPDCNLPSGESLARQFLIGQRFFEKEFGARSTEFWNPDVFGYNGQLPQIMRLSGIKRFLTQKLSWNRFNKPQSHTFHWQAIDGSSVLAHFPPADTYNCVASIPEIRYNVSNFKDHDRSNHSLMLFGYGDGGGGPTKEMLEVFSRLSDLQGLPRVTMRSPSEFFALLEKNEGNLLTQVGELYFEYHRGTYTTHGAIKRAMRKSEFLMHDVEFLAAAASRLAAREDLYPSEELDRLWKIMLLNQFHDILPGSSIDLVYEDAASQFTDVATSGQLLRAKAARALASTQRVAVSAGRKKGQKGKNGRLAPVNTIGFARRELSAQPDGRLTVVEAPAYGFGSILGSDADVLKRAVTVAEKGSAITLENAYLRARFNQSGDLVSLIDKRAGREALAHPGNRLQIYVDKPEHYDAWDVDPWHLETVKDCPAAHSYKVKTTQGADGSVIRAEIVFSRKVGLNSTMKQTARLDADAVRLEFHCQCDWQEEHKMLKVLFPVNVRNMNATYEMQFGVVERPTHYNTTYDLARYEVPGHKWVDLSEHGFGIALLSDCKYGFSTFANEMRISLLRAAKVPDPSADMRTHEFAYAIMPHEGTWQNAGVVAEAFRFNVPIMWTESSDEAPAAKSFAAVEDPNLVLDTIKKAEDGTALVLRFYEAHGARGTARVKVDLPFARAIYSNILEDDGEDVKMADGMLEIPYEPFKIITVKLA